MNRLRHWGLVIVVAAMGQAVVPASAETLMEALSSAYATNPQIASALLSVKASAEDIALRKAGKMPTIGAGADISQSYSDRTGSMLGTQSASVGLSYNQVLFDNLKTDADIEAGRALSVVAKEQLRNSVQNVLLSAAQAYVGVVRDTRLVQLRAESVKFFQAQVQSSKDRLDIGEGTALEKSQAEARLAQAVASYKAAIANLQTSQASYQRWIGHKPQNLSLNFDFNGALPRSLDEAQNSAESQHPAILSAKAALRAAQASTDAARAAFGPTLKLTGNIGSSFSTTNGAAAAIVNSGSVTLSLSIPIYSGGALGASVRKANLNQIKSEVDALTARDQVMEAVTSSWAGLINAGAQIDSAGAAVAASRLALDGVMEQRNVGQSTTLDVLDAQTSLITVQEGQIGAEASRYIAAFSLLAASGRLSAEDLGLAVTVQTGDGYIQKVEDVWQDLRSVSQ